MEYLVLKSFVSIGKFLKKGTVVDESELRSPRLRISEGKVVPAVSSFIVPAASESEGSELQDDIKDTNTDPNKGGDADGNELSDGDKTPNEGDNESDNGGSPASDETPDKTVPELKEEPKPAGEPEKKPALKLTLNK